MDKNKGHMDAKEFFRLLDADANQTTRDLDEFDLEALEGLKLVKDPEQAKITADANIDKKLAELLEEEKKDKAGLYIAAANGEKKDKPKTGLYIMSIAASLVLLLGLFFVFKGFNKDAATNMADVSMSNEVTGQTDTNKAPLPPTENNSDARIVSEKEPVKAPGVKAPAIPLETKTDGEVYTDEGGYFSQTDTATNPPKYRVTTYDEVENTFAAKDVDDTQSDKKNQNEEIALKEEEKKSVRLESQIMQKNKFDVAEDAMVVTDNSKQKETVKKRAVVKGKAKKTESTNADYAAAPPMMDQKSSPVQQSSDSTITGSTPIAITSGSATTLTQNQNTTLTTPGGTTYTWSNKPVTVTATNGATTSPSAPVVKAEFTGGKTALDVYIKKNLKVPASCVSEEVIIVKFTVDAKGIISKPKITSKTGNCKDCETEAIRFVKAMPAWVAATQGGKAISSSKTIALSFKK